MLSGRWVKNIPTGGSNTMLKKRELPMMNGNLSTIRVCRKKPIAETYGEYGTSPNMPDAMFVKPVIVSDFAYSRFVVARPNNASDPFKAPNVFVKLSSPASTAVRTTPVFHVNGPSGNKPKLRVVDVCSVSTPNKRTCKIQPTTMPMSKA